MYLLGDKTDDICHPFNFNNEQSSNYILVKTKVDKYFSVRKNVIYGSRCQMNLLMIHLSLHCLVEHYRFGSLKEKMIRNCLVVGHADVTLSKRLQMDPNLTLQRAIESARNSELVKRQQGKIRNTVKSYEIKALIRETNRASEDKCCPWWGFIELTRGTGARLITVVVLNVANCNITSNDLLQKLRNKLVSDFVNLQVINFCQNGWPSQARVGNDLQPYFQVRNNISFQRELLLKCDRIVIPKILRK